MLRRLIIKNIALIESETIEFSYGFTVFSGETGAGKSLIIDSLNLVLGSRADKSLITFGKEFAQVEAVFDCLTCSTKEILNEFGIDDEDEIIVSRRIWQDGRNDIKVNGHSLTVKMLKTLSSTLVDVCGQFENQTMFSSSNQLALVDSLANNGALLKDLNDLFDQEKSINEKLEELGGNETERERMLDMLSFQISEIEDAAFLEDEEEQLLLSHKKIIAKEKIIDAVSNALKVLDQEMEDNVADKLKESSLFLSNISQNDEKLAEIESKLSALSYDARDCISDLESVANEYSSNELNVDEIEERLDTLNKFKKKYGSTIADINKFCNEAKEKYNLLLDSADSVEKLLAKKAEIARKAREIADKISEKRKDVSASFSKDIEKELSNLGMKSAKFMVSVERKQINTRNGIDDIEFRFSANSGMPVASLAKVASGGELSRFMLALKTVLGKHSDIATMVFDEIDSGISGVVGRIVGEKLYGISKECQVVCVSHLAQIAAIADNNYLIEKFEDGNSARTKVSILNNNLKISEVARLAGGEVGAEVALAHAADLINKANNYKNSLNK